MSADYGPAAWIPTTHCWSGRKAPARWVVVHGTGYSLAQTAADVANDFAGGNPNSAHFAVGRAGDVAQMVRVGDSAWANGVLSGPPGVARPGDVAAPHDAWWDAAPEGNPNWVTVSIEHVNDAQNGTPLSPAQQAASFALIADLCAQLGVNAGPADAEGGVTGHYSVDPAHRAHCPGAYPWDALWAYLRAHSLRKLPHVASMSEFGFGYNGDCTQTAHQAALHTIDPARWPLTPAAVAALNRRDIAAGLAGPSGSQTAEGLAQSLRTDGVDFTQLLPGDWAGTLATYGGIRPIILQVAHAGGALPGDEPGVAGHAIACLAWNPAHNAGLFCDGDNAAASAPVRYTLAQLTAAQPFACTVLNVEPRASVGQGGGAMPVPAGWTDDGTTLRAPNGQPVVKGFRVAVTNWAQFSGTGRDWEPSDYPLGPEATVDQLEIGNPSLGGGAQQLFRMTMLGYTDPAQPGGRGVFREWVGQELAATRAALAAQQAEVAALKAQIAAAQAAPVASPQPQEPDPRLVADSQAIQQIKAIVASL